jgi:hypothetical protein
VRDARPAAGLKESRAVLNSLKIMSGAQIGVAGRFRLGAVRRKTSTSAITTHLEMGDEPEKSQVASGVGAPALRRRPERSDGGRARRGSLPSPSRTPRRGPMALPSTHSGQLIDVHPRTSGGFRVPPRSTSHCCRMRAHISAQRGLCSMRDGQRCRAGGSPRFAIERRFTDLSLYRRFSRNCQPGRGFSTNLPARFAVFSVNLAARLAVFSVPWRSAPRRARRRSACRPLVALSSQRVVTETLHKIAAAATKPSHGHVAPR